MTLQLNWPLGWPARMCQDVGAQDTCFKQDGSVAESHEIWSDYVRLHHFVLVSLIDVIFRIASDNLNFHWWILVSTRFPKAGVP